MGTAKGSLLHDSESGESNVGVVGLLRNVASCDPTCKKEPYKGYGSASRVWTPDCQKWPVNRGRNRV